MGIDYGKWIGLGLTGYGVYQGAKQSGRANDLQGQSQQQSEEQWRDRAPFRQMALQGVQNASTPVDSAGLFQDAGNPYSQSFAGMHSRDLGAEMAGPAITPPAPPPTTPDGRPMAPLPSAEAERVRGMFDPNWRPPATSGSASVQSSPEEARRMSMQEFLRMQGGRR